jgi:hypothetical protein
MPPSYPYTKIASATPPVQKIFLRDPNNVEIELNFESRNESG